MRRSFAVAAFAAVSIVALAAPPLARADLVGEFYARLKGITTWGAYTAVLESRVYETDGSPPPDLASAEIRFPRGAAIRKLFLSKRFYCDPAKLERKPDPRVCRRSHFGSGELLLDGRPWIEDGLPADVELFLGRAESPDAVASVLVLVRSNDRSPAYDFQVLRGQLLRDSHGFGYRLVLPTAIRPRLPGLKLRLAELSLTVRGLRLVRTERSCASRAASGRCLRSRTRRRSVFWTRTPACPRARRVTFEANYAFEGHDPIVKRRRLNCRRFLRRPSAHRKGTVPGAPA